MGSFVIRAGILIGCGLAALALNPIPDSLTQGLGETGRLVANLLVGIAVAAVGVGLEWRLRQLPLRALVGGFVGLFAGAASAWLILAAVPIETPALRPILFLLLGLAGMLLGAHQGDRFHPGKIGSAQSIDDVQRRAKILDTSVIIDGRIMDICETGFIDGKIVVPEFVLRELQYVADSSDSLKRNRGRKGLDILQRMKKLPNLDVVISDADFPSIREVDHKLIELALQTGGKVVTNDFNLNKVARLRGIEVLNINELANSLKPVVLPGETMKVFILKEGKEANQGVAYLDDGTMVVVDNARRQIGQNVSIVVTSVLQTTAGKMFFGRVAGEERGPRRIPREREGDGPA